MRPTVEVLIASYNTRDELGVTLRSLLDHAPRDKVELRVAVLDNASTDGSPEMVETAFPEVTLIRSPTNLGFARANNALAEQSTADYLLLLNSDVIVESDFIWPLVEVLQERAEVIAAGPRLVSVNRNIQKSAQRFPTLAYEFASVMRGRPLGRLLGNIFDSQAIVDRIEQTEMLEHDDSRDTEFMWATCWLLRREDVKGGRLFDPSFRMYDEDLDFCRRAAAQQRAFAYVRYAVLVHVGGASTQSSAKKQRLIRRARRRYYYVHHGWLTAGIYVAFVPLVALTAKALQAPGPRIRSALQARTRRRTDTS